METVPCVDVQGLSYLQGLCLFILDFFQVDHPGLIEQIHGKVEK